MTHLPKVIAAKVQPLSTTLHNIHFRNLWELKNLGALILSLYRARVPASSSRSPSPKIHSKGKTKYYRQSKLYSTIMEASLTHASKRNSRFRLRQPLKCPMCPNEVNKRSNLGYAFMFEDFQPILLMKNSTKNKSVQLENVSGIGVTNRIEHECLTG